jgi:transposase-like protein
VEDFMSKEISKMHEAQEQYSGSVPGDAEGARRATGASPGTAGALGPGQRWSLRRKREVMLRLLRGESLDAVSRELGVPIYRLEAWRDAALAAVDGALKSRKGASKTSVELDAALKRVGELTMENELLRARCRAKAPLARRRSKS